MKELSVLILALLLVLACTFICGAKNTVKFCHECGVTFKFRHYFRPFSQGEVRFLCYRMESHTHRSTRNGCSFGITCYSPPSWVLPTPVTIG